MMGDRPKARSERHDIIRFEPSTYRLRSNSDEKYRYGRIESIFALLCAFTILDLLAIRPVDSLSFITW